MLNEKIELLFQTINASNTSVAKAINTNPSTISRLRCGTRVPKPSSPTTKKLVEGCYLYADSINALPKLKELIGSNSQNANDIKKDLINWLYPVSNIDIASPKSSKPTTLFGDKLSTVMTLIGLSNANLAKRVHIDSSQISRFRNNVRIPRVDSEIAQRIAATIFEYTISLNKLSELAKIMNSQTSLLHDEALGETEFFKWLFSFDTTHLENEAIDRFLDRIDSFSLNAKLPLLDSNQLMQDILNVNAESSYYGIKGLQDAALRFLARSITSHVKEIWLYSDQSMDWLTSDHIFILKWMTLMNEIVSSGIKIKIIHNIERDISKMISAIENWIPIYMSGMVEPYYCKINIGNRFSHTIFLSPDFEAVDSFSVRGLEGNAFYYYHTDTLYLEKVQKSYEELLSECNPLLRIYPERNREALLLQETLLRNESSLTIVGSTPTIETIEKNSFKEMLAESKLDLEENNYTAFFYNIRSSLFESILLKGKITEFISLKQENEYMVNTNSILGKSFSYSKSSYTAHIDNIIKILEAYPKYQLCLLPETPFNNIEIRLLDDIVMVVKTRAPKTVFVLNHPLMIKVFRDYIESFKDKYILDKNSTILKLKEYLNSIR